MTPWPDGLQRLDERLFLAIHGGLHDVAGEGGHALLRFANECGNGYAFAPVALALLALDPSPRRSIPRVIRLVLLMLAVAFLVHTGKEQFPRDRPGTALAASFESGAAHSEFADASGRGSFPSGHTATAFAGVTLLASWAGGIASLGRRRLARIVLFTFAGLTGLARIYAGAHFPLDVLGGMLVGVSLGLIAARVPGPGSGRDAERSPG